MIFSDTIYPLFLAASVAAFHLLPSKLRPWSLFVTGAVFYAYYADVFLVLLLLEIVLVYALGKRCRSSRWAFAAALTITLSILLYFKYSSMALTAIGNLTKVFSGGGLPSFEQIVLPLAISFFTFEFIHYIVDSRKGTIETHDLGDFLAFIMFFPTMVAGPIKRFQDFAPKMRAAAFSYDDLNAGVTRILVGFAKKIVIADTMSLWIQPLNSVRGVAGASPGALRIALLAYSVKIYMDFSGYSDIAIGSARLFGIKVPENFNWPYLRGNIASFWRHWHMSLTAWIIDYIYIPLGGSRSRLWGVVALNTMIAMSASGLWHGADWHFVAWGFYHGALLVGYRLYRDKIRPALTGTSPAKTASRPAGPFWRQGWWALRRTAAVLFTFGLVTLGWGLFVMPVGRFAVAAGKIFTI